MKRVNNKDKDNILMDKKTKMHPTAEQRKDIKHISKEEFTRRIVRCGSSGHIGVSKHWVDRMVKVTMEEVKE